MSYSQPPVQGYAGFIPTPTSPPVMPTATNQASRQKRKLLVLAVMIPVLMIIGIISSIIGGPPREYPELHPRGPYSAWLDPGYANGYTTWALEGEPMGVSSDRRVLLVAEGYGDYAKGLDLRTGEVIWEHAGLYCGYDKIIGGSAICSSEPSEDGPQSVVRLDIATGIIQELQQLNRAAYSVESVGTTARLMIVQYVQVDDLIVVALSNDGSQVWQAKLPYGLDCKLIEQHVACDDSSGYAVLDAFTGETTLPFTDLTSGQTLVWAADGLMIELGYREQTAFDFSGNPITEEIPQAYLASMFPNEEHGFYYELADFANTSNIRAVDAAGKAVVARGRESAFVLLPSGAPIESGYVDAMSADGSVILLNTYSESRLMDRDGTDIKVLGTGYLPIEVIGGIIFMYRDGGGYDVFVPSA